MEAYDIVYQLVKNKYLDQIFIFDDEMDEAVIEWESVK